MQKAFLQTLYEIAENDKNVMMLSADNGLEFDKLFKRDFEKQYLEFGIAECNMVGAAAGLALSGKIPFVHTASNFLAYRAFEFIRNDVCIHNANVKIIGFGSGLANSTLGPSHHSTEDIGVLYSLPNLTILSASTPVETELAIKEAYSIVGPVYIRIGLVGESENQEKVPKNIFKMNNNILHEGSDAAIFSTGPVITEVLKAANLISKKGFNVKVVNVNTIKPFDKLSLVKITKDIKKVFTVEEHNIHGGLGSIIANFIAEEKINTDLTKLGLKDTFARGYGTQQDVQQQNGLDSISISNKVLETLTGL